MIDGVYGFGSDPNLIQDAPSSVMGKDDFLNMLITQLKYQDPLDPMDGSQFAAQLAQFSSLEQLTNINDTLNFSIDANYYLTQSINNTLAATLIGRDVKLSRNDFKYSGQEQQTLGYNLGSNAVNVTVKIYNEGGALVKTIEDAPGAAGENKLNWDFTDNDGNTVPEGNYTFEVEAIDGNDLSVSADKFVLGLIEGVRFTETGTVLVVNGAEYNLADILELYDPTQE